MAEKINSSKNKKEIKEDLVNLKIDYFKCDSANDSESKLITKTFRKDGNDILKGKTLSFFYNELLDWNKKVDNVNNDRIISYFQKIKQEVRYALNTQEILQKYEDYIDVLDRPADDEKKKLLPRYKKMKRLQSMYEIIIKFFMTLLHNFFWNDIILGVDVGVGTKNLNYRIQ